MGAAPSPKLTAMPDAGRLLLADKPRADVRKQLYPDWDADTLNPQSKVKALASFHSDGTDISAMFTNIARGSFLFRGKQLSEAALGAAIPTDGLARVIGSGSLDNQVKVDVVKTDWLATNPGSPVPIVAKM